jgi:hypothetical protein
MAEVSIESDVRFARNLLGQFASHLDGAAMATLTETLEVGLQTAKAAAPDGPARDDYGRRVKLRENIHIVMFSSTSGAIRIDAVNALSQETGAVPHSIDAVNADNLVFFWEKAGRMFVGPHVDHPGNPAQPYMEVAFAAMDEAAEGIMDANY